MPGATIVESKSLQLFLGAFRNHGAFHEDCTGGIGERLFAEMQPEWLRIGGYWYPRGGIPIDVFWQSGEPPAGVWVPPQDVPGYRGRGCTPDSQELPQMRCCNAASTQPYSFQRVGEDE